MLFPRSPGPPAPMDLLRVEERWLGLLAWSALREYAGGLPPRGGESLAGMLAAVVGEEAAGLAGRDGVRLCAKVGCFVTLFHEGDLRGCIGSTEGRQPLYLAVPRLARAAASRDSRFPPIEAAELPQITGEITILGECIRCPASPDLLSFIRPGDHGVRIRLADRSALLLPKVAARLGWDARELLDQVAVKAGLPPDAWRDSRTEVFAFTARSFEAGDSA